MVVMAFDGFIGLNHEGPKELSLDPVPVHIVDSLEWRIDDGSLRIFKRELKSLSKQYDSTVMSALLNDLWQYLPPEKKYDRFRDALIQYEGNSN